MQCCRAFASMWIVNANEEKIFPRHFQSGFSQSVRTISWEIVQPSLAFKVFRKNVAFYTKQDLLFHIDATWMVGSGFFGSFDAARSEPLD